MSCLVFTRLYPYRNIWVPTIYPTIRTSIRATQSTRLTRRGGKAAAAHPGLLPQGPWEAEGARGAPDLQENLSLIHDRFATIAL